MNQSGTQERKKPPADAMRCGIRRGQIVSEQIQSFAARIPAAFCPRTQCVARFCRRKDACIRGELCFQIAGRTQVSPKADPGILRADFWGSKRRIPGSAARGWPECDL